MMISMVTCYLDRDQFITAALQHHCSTVHCSGESRVDRRGFSHLNTFIFKCYVYDFKISSLNLYFVFIFSNIFHYICSAALDQSLLVSGCCVLCNVLVCKIWDIFKHAQSYLCISGSYGFKQVQYKKHQV